MTFVDRACTFECAGDELVAIASVPEEPWERGVVVVVGGPQYRVGSHRQFTLLARRLAAHGVATLRFDYRGMGDSSGEPRTFEAVEADIRAAVDELQRQCPAVSEVVLWGLCDAASASMMYAASDRRIRGLVLLNPWARTVASLARTHLKHYYTGRLVQLDFWKKVASGEFGLRTALTDLVRSVKLTRAPRERPDSAPFQTLMARGLKAFGGRSLLLLAGEDLTAKEFLDHIALDPEWRCVLDDGRVTRLDLQGCDHTFSTAVCRRKVEDATLEWLASWPHDANDGAG
jgi:exosortase A-associated hydrolase 1